MAAGSVQGRHVSVLDRIRNLFFYRAVCPTCAIVFRISKFEQRLVRHLPSPYGKQFFLYPSFSSDSNERMPHRRRGPRAMSAEESNVELRPAVLPVRAASGPPALIPEPPPPFRMTIHSSFLGIDLDLTLKGGTLLKNLNQGIRALTECIAAFTRTSVVPVCRQWLENSQPPLQQAVSRETDSGKTGATWSAKTAPAPADEKNPPPGPPAAVIH